MFGRSKITSSFEVFNSELKHVEHVSVENAPNDKIVRSFLLVTSQGEQTAVVLDCLVLNKTRVFHGNNVVGLPPEQL